MDDAVQKLKRAANAFNEKPITVIIATESILYSIVRDLLSVLTFGAAIAVNVLTINSNAISFIFSCVLIIYWLSAMWRNEDRVIRGKTVEEVCNALADRLRSKDYR